jgi:hypothetical protein
MVQDGYLKTSQYVPIPVHRKRKKKKRMAFPLMICLRSHTQLASHCLRLNWKAKLSCKGKRGNVVIHYMARYTAENKKKQ